MPDQKFGPDQLGAGSKRGGLVQCHTGSTRYLLWQSATPYPVLIIPASPHAVVDASRAK